MPILKVSGLQVNYGKTVALTDANLTVEPCEFLGIIGPNGGGKTTLIKAILGIGAFAETDYPRASLYQA